MKRDYKKISIIKSLESLIYFSKGLKDAMSNLSWQDTVVLDFSYFKL